MADSPGEVAIRLECLREAVKIGEVQDDKFDVVSTARDFYNFVWRGDLPKAEAAE